MNDFNSNNFAIQVIASGSFVDQPVHDSSTYLVETAMVRLNREVLHAWTNIKWVDDRESFETDKEFEAYVNGKKHLLQKFEQNIAQAVGFTPDPDKEKINVTQVVSEVFAVAWIHEVKGVVS